MPSLDPEHALRDLDGQRTTAPIEPDSTVDTIVFRGQCGRGRVAAARADVFAFGTEAQDGDRGRTAIGEFKLGSDAIDLGETGLARHRSLTGSPGVAPEGDADRIVLICVAQHEDALSV